MGRDERILTIAHHDLGRIEQEALAAWPEEGCGVLVGEAPEEDSAIVRRVVPAANEHAGDRTRRFAISPRALLAAHKQARAEGLEVIGYWHSHPGGKARPSERDRQAAWPGESHLIVALHDGRVVERRCWRLIVEGGRFAELKIRYSPTAEAHFAPARTRDERER